MSEEFQNFELPVDAYASFDAQSLRRLIIDRLNNNSSVDFTDQNFEGSNLSSIIDIIAYSYNTLLFYLNQTSSEANFSEATIYENINRIVKLIDYKPIGKQTCVLPVKVNATENLGVGFYTIPRFSTVNENGKIYSFVNDVTFEKTQTGSQTLSAIDSSNFMYQGIFEEYPVQNALGEAFEAVTLLPGDQANVDHFNNKVFVKEAIDNQWHEWTQATSLFLHGPNERIFEARLNHNKHYEFKFGNNVHGKQLRTGDQIAVYYLRSDGQEGKVTKSTFNESQLTLFKTDRYNAIFDAVKDTTLSYLTLLNALEVNVTNTEDSTDFGEEESVDAIRANAPRTFASEYKLITAPDYKNAIRRYFANVIYDVNVGNNSDYLNDYLKYVTDDLGLDSYEGVTNATFNQHQFADSCDFNNIFVVAVPKTKKNGSVVTRSNYVSPALKTQIIDRLRPFKLITGEIVFLDPMYMQVDFGIIGNTDEVVPDVSSCSELIITKNANVIKSDESIAAEAYKILIDYFEAAALGQTLGIQKLTSDILSIQGVQGISVKRTDIDLEKAGLNFAVWNPVYLGNDVKFADADFNFRFFQIPFIQDKDVFRKKIKVRQSSQSQINKEF